MEGLKWAKIRFEGRREIFRQPMVTTIKSGIRIRSDQASSSSHFDDSWQRFTTKSAYTGNGDVEPRTGVSFRIQGSVKMQNLQRFYDRTIGNGYLFRPTPSANKRESFVDRFDDHWNISVSWKTINASDERKASDDWSVTIEKFWNPGVLNPCVIEGSSLSWRIVCRGCVQTNREMEERLEYP